MRLRGPGRLEGERVAAAQRLAERAGFAREGVLHESALGADSVCFGAVASAWA